MTTLAVHDAGSGLRRSTRLFLTLSLALYFAFGLYHLGQFSTADEDLWFADPLTGRIHAYFAAMSTGNWEKTRINDKPGVTTALISGLVGLRVDTHPEGKIKERFSPYVKVYDTAMFERTVFFYRLPILIVNGLLILLMFFLLRTATDDETLALFSVILISLSPVLLGISQIVNPDATMWSFGFASLLSFFAFLRTGSWRYTVLAGLLGGLSLASKYSATFILLFAGFALGVHFLFRAGKTDRETFARELKVAFLAFLAFLALAFSVFAAVMPAVFSHPEYLYSGTIGFRMSTGTLPVVLVALGLGIGILLDILFARSRVTYGLFRRLAFLEKPLIVLFAWVIGSLLVYSLVNWMGGNLFKFPSVTLDLGRFKDAFGLDLFEKIQLEVKTLPFSVTPLVLFSALLALFLAPWKRFGHRSLVLLFGAFITLFYSAVLLQDVLLTIRYGILLYPAMAVLAAIGLRFLVSRLPTRPFVEYMAPGVILAVSFVSLFLTKPFYFNYTNDLLPKAQIVSSAWGYGGYEAAAALNRLPGAEALTVWSDYDGFCRFFVGKCLSGSTIRKHTGKRYAGSDVEYFVKTRRGSILNKGIWSDIKKQKAIEEAPFWTLEIDDRPKNYVHIYQARPSDGDPAEAIAPSEDDKSDESETEEEAVTPDSDI